MRSIYNNILTTKKDEIFFLKDNILSILINLLDYSLLSTIYTLSNIS